MTRGKGSHVYNSLKKHAQAALEACGHAELVEAERNLRLGVSYRDEVIEEILGALRTCRGLFSEVRMDWSDPRAECREGCAVIDAILAKYGDGQLCEHGHADRYSACNQCSALEIEGYAPNTGDDQ